MIKQAVLLVGGMGTRLGERTRHTPKPLLEVAGRPFLFWLMDELRRHGLSDILLLTGFEGERIAQAVAGQPGVRTIREPEPLGTGGALRFAADELAERFFFLNGDSLFDFNLLDLAAVAQDAEAILAVRTVPDASRYGRVVLEGNRVVDFGTRSEAGGAALINGGVGVFARRIVERILPAGAVSIEHEVYPAMAAEGALFAKAYDSPFIDIGVPDDFDRAQTFIPLHLRRGAVIFDRDGVLNVDTNYVHRPDQVQWIDGAIEAVKAVNDAGLFAFVATNQAGVAHGYYPEEQIGVLHDWMSDQMALHGAHIDAFVYSPFHPQGTLKPYRRVSDCRKPGAGMLTRLFDMFDVDRSRSIMIGDKPSDVAAANSAGIQGMLFDGGNLAATMGPVLAQLRKVEAPLPHKRR